jgi:hypothetical protein
MSTILSVVVIYCLLVVREYRTLRENLRTFSSDMLIEFILCT